MVVGIVRSDLDDPDRTLKILDPDPVFPITWT